MADLFLKVEFDGADLLNALQLTEKNLRWVAAKTMTGSAKHAQDILKNKTPQHINNPTRWTLNSTFLKIAKPTDLVAYVGFKDYASKGTPAADYLQPIAAGEPRRAKPHENLLRSRGLIRGNEFLVPTGISPFKLNQYGNITSGNYTMLLSRLRSLRESGSTGNRTNSTRSSSKRRQRDFFVGSINGSRAVYTRTRNGVKPVFAITRQPSYKQSFPVRRILTDAVNDVFGREFKKQVERELNFRRGRG
jgi:hypothetical protein